jgi:hypothetical protein
VWSIYPAITNVNIAGNSIYTSTGDLTLSNSSGSNISFIVSPYTAYVDSNGLNLSNSTTTNGYFWVDASGYLWWYNAFTTCQNQITSN